MENGIWVWDYGWTREGAITWAGGTKSWCQLSNVLWTHHGEDMPHVALTLLDPRHMTPMGKGQQ
ncbi:hypothetical protein JHK85_012517 [Glycine max]|nr:hypothetical protein JHK85_012517 [Glycine max]